MADTLTGVIAQWRTLNCNQHNKICCAHWHQINSNIHLLRPMFVQCCVCRGHVVLFKHLQILRMSMFIQAIRVIQDSHSFFSFSFYERKWDTDWSIC